MLFWIASMDVSLPHKVFIAALSNHCHLMAFFTTYIERVKLLIWVSTIFLNLIEWDLATWAMLHMSPPLLVWYSVVTMPEETFIFK